MPADYQVGRVLPQLTSRRSERNVNSPVDARAAALAAWLAQQDLADAQVSLLAADASFRRYFRARRPDGQSFVVMDAPPAKESCEAFVRVAELLAQADIPAPRVLVADEAAGFLLLTDLGDESYLQALADPARAEILMGAAIDLLVRWQMASRPGVLPPYGEALLSRELELFPEWYVGVHLGQTPDARWWARWRSLSRRLIDNALEQPQVFVHRDYMPRNLMVHAGGPAVIDFQDAVCGPVSYDVVSLFRDAFLSWEEPRVRQWMARYRRSAAQAGLALPAAATFAQQADLMGVQRHLKVLGIFARLHYRDHKSHYLAETPRFLRYLHEAERRQPALAELAPLLAALPAPR